MTTYTINELNQAAWLVYINGLEIPVMGVTTKWGVWQMPTAQIQLVPHPMISRIGYEDRLQVVVFYLDTFWFADNPQFCLLGEFEVSGWSYTNTPRGRAIQLECTAQDKIFEQLNFYYLSSITDIAEASNGPQASLGSFKTTKLLYPSSLFMEGLTTAIELPEESLDESSDATKGFIKRPIDFVTNIFRAILSPVADTTQPYSSPNDCLFVEEPGKLPSGAATVPSKNFFARWMKMTKFHKRWCALPGIEDQKKDTCFPILEAIRDTETLKALQSQIGQSIGDAGNAWQLLQFVLGSMYMEVAMIPSPPTAIVNQVTGIIQPSTTVPTKEQFRGIVSHFVKPQCFFSLPPTCNVIFPSMTGHFSFAESYLEQPTRLYLSEEYISNYLMQGEYKQTSDVGTIARNMLGTGYPQPIRKRLLDLSSDPVTNDKSCLLFPEEFFKGPVAARLNGPPWMYMLWKQKSTKEIEALAEMDATYGAEVEVNSVFDAYAEYEYYRSRYAARQGGLDLAWNPYILPGFPTAIFDEENAGLHSMAYVNTVTHTMNASGASAQMSTNIGLSFMRTMTEFIGIMGDPTSYSAELDIAPVEIIPLIKEQFQTLENAQNIYEKLLFGGRKLTRPAVFNWKKMVRLKTAFGVELDLNYDDLKNKGLSEVMNVYLTPDPAYKPLFDSYTAAMQYVSRPVCTLREYIEAYHEKTLQSLLDSRVVRGEYRSFYSVTKDKDKTEGAIFWGRIYTLMQGPGTDPGVTVSNVGPAPDYYPSDAGLKMVDRSTGMPETRHNWDQILEEYRKIVRSEEGKVAPQR
jgi:hypothetical protein